MNKQLTMRLSDTPNSGARLVVLFERSYWSEPHDGRRGCQRETMRDHGWMRDQCFIFDRVLKEVENFATVFGFGVTRHHRILDLRAVQMCTDTSQGVLVGHEHQHLVV